MNQRWLPIAASLLAISAPSGGAKVEQRAVEPSTKQMAAITRQIVEKRLPPQTVEKYYQSQETDYPALSPTLQKYAVVLANYDKLYCLCANNDFSIATDVQKSCLRTNDTLTLERTAIAKKIRQSDNPADIAFTLQIMSRDDNPSYDLAYCEAFASAAGMKTETLIPNVRDLRSK